MGKKLGVAGWVGALALIGVVSCTRGSVDERAESSQQTVQRAPPLVIGSGTTLASLSDASHYGPPAIATDGEGFLVVWAELVPGLGNSGGRVLARKVEEAGAAAGPTVVLFESTDYLGEMVGVTFAGGQYVVSWNTYATDLPDGLVPYAAVGATLDAGGQATLGSTTLQAADRVDQGPRHDMLVSDGSSVFGVAANNDLD